MIRPRLASYALAVAALVAPFAHAEEDGVVSGWKQLNMTEGVTAMSRDIYQLHMEIFWICVVIAVLVFAVMIYSLVKFRKSQGAVADVTQVHNTKVEIVWTIVPVIILVAMAVPAARTLVRIEDTTHSELTIKVTGFQWGWNYDYLDDGVSYFSHLDRASDAARDLGSGIDPSGVQHYLLNVDHPLVVPAGVKVRLLITGADVIHAWWIPALGAKQDAIPGFLRDIWFRVDKDKPGVYRGQCVELCGKEHGFMPIVVRAVSSEDYTKWVGEQKKKMAVAEADSTKEWTEAELVARGEKVFSSVCAACHQGNGQGIPNTFPPLVGSKVVNGPKTAQIDTVLHGRKGVYRPNTQMPPQDSLSDVDIASAITFTRHSWGNKPKENVVQPTEVKAQRAKK